jgi:hypothetical protein
MIITAFPSNIQINPKNHRELALVKNFRVRESGVTLNTDSLTLVREGYAAAINWIYNEYGRFENPPATITTNSGTIIPSYLDLKNVKIKRESIDLGIEARKSFGHFFENAAGLTFELLNQKGFLTNDLKINVPYIIIPDDLQQQRGIAIITLLAIGYQLAHIAFEIIKVAAAFLDFVPPGLLTAIAQAVGLVIFFAITLIQFLQAAQNLVELYFPQVRYFKAIKDFDLIRRGCEYLGYTLESNLLSIDLSNYSTMGVPEAVAGKSTFNNFQNEQTQYFNRGYPTAADSTPTLDSLIKHIEEQCDARTFVHNGVVKIERRSYFQGTANIRLVPTLTDQAGHEDEYVFNDGESWGRRYDHWQIDYTDMHSPDTYDGMKSEYITTPIVTLNADLVRLNGLKENAAPFALAGRKNSLTKVEVLVSAFLGNLYGLISLVGGGSITDTVNDRNGVMIISQQYFSSTKKLWLDVEISGGKPYGKQPDNYKDIMSMDNFFTQFKTGLNVINNNFALKSMRVPFTDENFISLLQNNFVIYEPTNQPVEVVEIEWFDKKHSANIVVLLPDSSAFNTKTTKLA